MLQVGQQVHLPCLHNHGRVKLHIGSVTSHSIKSPPEIEKVGYFPLRKPLGYVITANSYSILDVQQSGICQFLQFKYCTLVT